MRAEWIRTSIVAAVAAAAGTVIGGGMLRAQPAGDATPTTAVMTPTGPAVRAHLSNAIPGSLVVTRMSDTSFVVVKDEGDAQLVTLFSTEGGLVTKKHNGRFFY